jgi:hypothetical protein
MQRDTRCADAKLIETQIAEGRARNAQAHRLAVLDAAWRASLTGVRLHTFVLERFRALRVQRQKHVWRRAHDRGQTK